MQAIVWKSDYNLGVPEIDAQHQQLVMVINQLQVLLRKPHITCHDVFEMLSEFEKYAEYHFETEKRWAKRLGVQTDDWLLHQKQHDTYSVRMQEFRATLRDDTPAVLVKLAAFLGTWWLSHILVEDRELGRLMLAGRLNDPGLSV